MLPNRTAAMAFKLLPPCLPSKKKCPIWPKPDLMKMVTIFLIGTELFPTSIFFKLYFIHFIALIFFLTGVTAMTAKTKVRKKTKTTSTKKTEATQADKYQIIQETAFFLAEARDFTPGHEIDDWITAEQLVESSVNRSSIRK